MAGYYRRFRCVGCIRGWFGRSGFSVTEAEVTRGTAVEIVYATGAVKPLRRAKVATIVKGRIVERCHCEGQTVRSGDLLARLDDAEAQATLRELKAREDFLRKEFERQTQLATRGFTPAQTLEWTDSELKQIQALIGAQTERLANYRLAAPLLLLPSTQVNIRAGKFPPAEANRVHYLKVPIKLPQ